MQHTVPAPAIDVVQRPFMAIWGVPGACNLTCRHRRAETAPLPHLNALTAAGAHPFCPYVPVSFPFATDVAALQ